MYHSTVSLWTVSEREPSETVRINNEAKVHEVCKDMALLAQESIHVLALDSKLGLIERFMVALGTVNSATTTPREVFRWAIVANAARIIMVHNHPSGDVEPSQDDYNLTKRMIHAGSILGIGIEDHVIVGTGGFYSFRVNNPELFDQKW